MKPEPCSPLTQDELRLTLLETLFQRLPPQDAIVAIPVRTDRHLKMNPTLLLVNDDGSMVLPTLYFHEDFLHFDPPASFAVLSVLCMIK